MMCMTKNYIRESNVKEENYIITVEMLELLKNDKSLREDFLTQLNVDVIYLKVINDVSDSDDCLLKENILSDKDIEELGIKGVPGFYGKLYSKHI